MKSLIVFVAFLAAVAALQKCCPQPENEGRCGCCPDACCCMCENVTVTLPPMTTPTDRPATTSEVCEIGGLDVCFIVDSSISVRSSGWAQAMTFLSDLVADPAWSPVGDGGSRFGMVKYSDAGYVEWDIMDPISDSVGSLQSAFGSVAYAPGFTNTIEGMQLATIMLTNDDRDDALYPDVAILISDGLTNDPAGFETMLDPVSADLRDAAGLVFAVGIGSVLSPLGVAELNLITGMANNESLYLVENFAMLSAALPDLLYTIKTRICETIRPPVPPTPAPATPAPPTTVQNCKCCCPPLPDPCNQRSVFSDRSSECGCCRYDHHGDRRRR